MSNFADNEAAQAKIDSELLKDAGVDLDETANVLMAGQAGQTISLRCAIAAREGKAWGCVMCKLLAVVVQPNHCALQFTSTPLPWWAALRAFLAICVAGWAFLEILGWVVKGALWIL